MAESADEGGDNGESDRGIIVQHTNRLIMNTYKSVDFCKRSTSLHGAAVFAKAARRKKNLNVFEMASIS